MAVIETWYNQDLQQPVKVHYLDGSMFSHNGNGNRIGVHVFNNGASVTLSGTVSGYVVTSDGSTVPCTGARSGNAASILIPAAAYQPGAVFITVFLTDGSTVTTLASVATNVMTARTNIQIDPGSVVTDWTQTINAAMQAVVDANAANMATPYDGLTYPVPLGKYTLHDNLLYRCISPIASSEAWTASHWTRVKLGDDVTSLANTVAQKANQSDLTILANTVAQKANQSDLTSLANTVAQKADQTEVTDLKSALNAIGDDIYQYSIRTVNESASNYRLNESDGFCSSASGYKLDKYAVTAGDIMLVVSDDRFQFQTVKSVPMSGTNNRVGATYGAGRYLVVVPDTATYLIVSTPTSSESAVYDCKNKINVLNVSHELFDIIKGEYYGADGTVKTDIPSYSRTDYIPCAGAEKIIIHSGDTFNNNIVFNANKEKLKLFTVSSGDSEITIPDNAAYIGFSGLTSRITTGFYIENIAITNKLTPIEKESNASVSLVKYLRDFVNANELTIDSTVSGYAMNASGLFYSSSDYSAVCYDVSALEKVYIINNTNAIVKYQFQTAKNTPVSGTNSYLVGDPVTTKTNDAITVPATAKYLFVAKESNNDPVTGAYTYGSNTDYTLCEEGIPADAKAVGERFDDIAKQIESSVLYATDVHINDPHYYVVGANETYTTITSAYNQWVTDGKPVGIIKVLPGTYEESINTGALVNNNRLYIIGEAKESTIWKMTDADYADAPFTCSGNITIRNISFIVDKTNSWIKHTGAYAIHTDNSGSKGCVIIEDVYAESTLNSAIGSGTSKDQQIIMKNVVLEHTAETTWVDNDGVNNGAFLYHTSASSNQTNQSIYLENVKAHSVKGPGMQILSSGNGDTDVDTTFRFCIAHSDYYETYDGGKYKESKVVFSNDNEKIIISEDSMCNNSYKLNYSE